MFHHVMTTLYGKEQKAVPNGYQCVIGPRVVEHDTTNQF